MQPYVGTQAVETEPLTIEEQTDKWTSMHMCPFNS